MKCFRLITILGWSSAAALATDIQLLPSGPIACPQAARDAARKAPKPVRIIVEDGVYPITEAITLGKDDSQVTWLAAPK